MPNRVPHPVVAEILRMSTPISPDLAYFVVSLEHDQHPLWTLNDLKRKTSELPVHRRTLRRTVSNIRLQFVSSLSKKPAFRAPVVLVFLLRPGLQWKRYMPKD